MLFRRRTQPRFSERLRIAAWPRQSWGRSFRYHGKRLLRLGGSPHVIAAGFACGVAVSWTPFVGFHFLMSAFLAFVIGGNLLASAIGTAVGNPFTFPFMWWSAYELGHRVLGGPGGRALGPPEAPQAFADFIPVLKPMLLGALPLGILSWVVAYLIVRFVVNAYQAARRQRLAEKRLRDPGAAGTSEA